MEQTPPPLAPSNEPARRGPPWLIPLIVIGALLFLGCAGLVGGGFFLVKNLKAPEARAGYGHPKVAKKLPDGWVRVRFPEVPMTLDLPD